MQIQTLCWAGEISIITSYSTSVKFFLEVWLRFSFQVHFVIQYMSDRYSVTISRESVVNHDECRHSIVHYRNPYHWLRENYEFKTTFGTNRIRGNESAIASTITWEKRKRTLRERTIFAFWLRGFLGCTVDVGKPGKGVTFFHFLKFVMNFLKGVVSTCQAFEARVNLAK